jgi:DNA-binding transcriptional LysR family regulator
MSAGYWTRALPRDSGSRRAQTTIAPPLDVKGPLVLDDMRAVLGAAREGNGLAYLFEQLAARDLESGAVERFLPSHALVREAFFLYYPSRRNLPPKLRVFVDWFREKNEPARLTGPSLGERRAAVT